MTLEHVEPNGRYSRPIRGFGAECVQMFGQRQIHHEAQASDRQRSGLCKSDVLLAPRARRGGVVDNNRLAFVKSLANRAMTLGLCAQDIAGHMNVSGRLKDALEKRGFPGGRRSHEDGHLLTLWRRQEGSRREIAMGVKRRGGAEQVGGVQGSPVEARRRGAHEELIGCKEAEPRVGGELAVCATEILFGFLVTVPRRWPPCSISHVVAVGKVRFKSRLLYLLGDETPGERVWLASNVPGDEEGQDVGDLGLLNDVQEPPFDFPSIGFTFTDSVLIGYDHDRGSLLGEFFQPQ